MGTLAFVFVTVCLLEMTGAGLVSGASAPKAPAEQKQGFQEKVQGELDDLGAKIRTLEAKSEKAGAKTRKQLKKDLRKLQADLEAARVKLANLKGSSGDVWESLKDESDKAARKVKASYDRLAAKLK